LVHLPPSPASPQSIEELDGTPPKKPCVIADSGEIEFTPEAEE
jgi:hypothetical protein